ncbi:NAD(P)-dependent alcohol dehydrogenase [Nocardia carnea]|uniref:NAD(P)-dependent alcohol dehydrogenase n=1 Tax=Nocardia carnea TaxID=37328 RepID=UPI002454A7BD|nr:NAD(P)-dependent alcohol dehydrogenase [Nocardia carnea]
MPTTITTAAVLRSTDGPYSIEELTLDPPGPDDITVRIAGAGLCHTDLLPRQQPGMPLPLVPGHEGAGVVEAAGSQVQGLAVGDHVVLSFDSCRTCVNCRRARPANCDTFFPRNMSGRNMDGSTNARDTGGAAVSARWFGQSSFATRAVVDARNVVKVDPDLPLELLGPLGCGFQTGAGAVLNSLGAEVGAGIVIFGAGAVGLASVMAARVAGAGTIVAVDLNPDRLELARDLGATHVIDGAADDVVRQARRIVRGGADYTLDTTGSPHVIATAIDTLRTSGVCGLIGAPAGDLSLSATSLSTGRTVKGIVEGDAVPQLFIPRLIALWQEGKFPFDRLIEKFALADIDAAECAARDGKVVKPVLIPQ